MSDENTEGRKMSLDPFLERFERIRSQKELYALFPVKSQKEGKRQERGRDVCPRDNSLVRITACTLLAWCSSRVSSGDEL